MKKSISTALAAVIILATTTTAWAGVYEQTIKKLDPPKESQIVKMGADGHLEYPAYNEEGDKVLDFSMVGYKNGDEPIPEVPVVKTISPISGKGDNTEYIQQAIDEVSAMPMDKSGIRGALLLKKGTYRIEKPIYIRESGVVLRGEGQDERKGTKIIATAKVKYNALIIGGSGSMKKIGNDIAIADSYVPVGANSFTVADASGLNLGDEIIVARDANDAWISVLGMDKIPDTNGTTNQWKASEYKFKWERKITKIEGNKITVNAPISTSIDERYSNGYVYRYSWEERITNSGVEDLLFDSQYQHGEDEEHGWVAVQILRSVDCWAQMVTSIHYAYSCVSIESSSRNITVQECTFKEPISTINGGLRYSFNLCGQLSLVTKSVSSEGRHDWVNGSRVLGPNVFYDNYSEKGNSVSEPHHRWSSGTLFDNIVMAHPNRGGATFEAINRNESGSGHGWAGANMVFWNNTSAVTIVSKPPTAQNFAVGVGSLMPQNEIEQSTDTTLIQANNMGRTQFVYKGVPLVGDGYIESPTGPVTPKSLYLQQRADREASLEYRLNRAVVLMVGQPKAICRTTQVSIDGENEQVVPMVVGGRTLLPLRFVAERFGAEVFFDEKTQTVTVVYGGKTAKMVLGDTTLYIDGKSITMDVAANTYNGRTFVPIRVLAEQLLGKQVFWDEAGVIVISDYEKLLDSGKDADTIRALIRGIMGK